MSNRAIYPIRRRQFLEQVGRLSLGTADRPPLVNIYEALALTVPGIVAHQSALRGGETLKIPQYDPPRQDL